MKVTENAITLRLEGSRAKGGVALPDLERFIDSFLAALRDFDRAQRGELTRKAGHPESRAQAVTAFRLVAFKKGSGIATIEPDVALQDGETDELVEVDPIQVTNLRSLLTSIEEENGLPGSVTDALERACRTVGDNGTLAVEVPGASGTEETTHQVVIDGPRIERIRVNAKAPPEPQVVSSISGRLHQVDFEPDKLAIRSSDGVDWACSFPPTLEHQVEKLVNRLVWATGSGTLQSPRKGTMRLGEIRSVDLGIQTSLFSGEPISDEDLALAQGITEPQGLDAIGMSEWGDADEVYLKALTED